MKYFKYIVFFVIVQVFIFQPLYAQQAKIDSLKQLLTTASPAEKIDLYIHLSGIYTSVSLEQSIEYGEKALDIALEEQNKEKQAESYGVLGVAYFYKGDYELTLEMWEKSLELYRELDIKDHIALQLTRIGVVYKNWGKYEKAIEYYQEALTIQDEIGDKKGQANTLNNIGNIYYFFGENYEEALRYYQDGYELFAEIENKSGMAYTLNSIGLVYGKRENYNEALEKYEQSLALFEEVKESFGIAMTQNNIGNIYAEKEQYNKALEYCRNSLQIYDEIGNQKSVASTQKEIGEIYFKMGYYSKALEAYNQSIAIYNKLNLKKEVIDNLRLISEVYEATGNYQQALNYFKDYSELKDSTFKEDSFKQIAELQTKFETQKKEKEIERLQKEQAIQDARMLRQKTITYSLIAGFVVILLLAFFAYSRYLIKKRANEKLEEQNQEIRKQKEEIETQRDEIERQRDVLAVQQKSIMDSIQYARRIQNAVLPPDFLIEEMLHDYFILWKPRDIVSGDFYWMTEKNNQVIVAAADCTGHGVPGAFMSMLGVSFLNEIVNKYETITADQILNHLRQQIMTSLHQTGKEGEAKDGMDIALCIIDFDKLEMQFAGAYNPLFLIRNNELLQYKADRMPIGIHFRKKNEMFTLHTVKLQKNDAFYIFSDGYQDQFGGEKMDKFKVKNFKKLLLEIHQKPMIEQREILDRTIEEWRGTNDQIDDIIVIGVRI